MPPRALSPLRLHTQRCFASITPDPTSASSLRDVARFGARVLSLDLQSSEDLICRQLLCEHVGDACACRLALALERVPMLQRLDLSNNRLQALPDAVYKLQRLEWLDVRQNNLMMLSTDVANLTQLQTLDVRYNNLETLPMEQLETLEKLKVVRVTGNSDLIRTFESLKMSERLKATFVLE
uniref:Disease resistance R13L4/SHOC-2-like LRR domain-containing protein n=1 Tax=Hyaloperonospora arabidopsidis (strain Emoy2) TaxID=559515 RepID=M4BCE6_HYAAE